MVRGIESGGAANITIDKNHGWVIVEREGMPTKSVDLDPSSTRIGVLLYLAGERKLSPMPSPHPFRNAIVGLRNHIEEDAKDPQIIVQQRNGNGLKYRLKANVQVIENDVLTREIEARHIKTKPVPLKKLFETESGKGSIPTAGEPSVNGNGHLKPTVAKGEINFKGEKLVPLASGPLFERRPLGRKVRALAQTVDPEVELIRSLKKESTSDKGSGRIADLVVRASQGEGGAFGRLYQIYSDRIYNYIYYKTGHSADAEDLTEQVFIKAWEAITRFRFEGKPFAAWLFKVARNTVIDHYRTRKTESDLSEVISAIAHDGDPEAFAQRRATAQALMTAIRSLTDEQQQVILLKFVDGMDNTEISATMGKQEGAIRALQYRALLSLQRILQDERYGLEKTPIRTVERNGTENHSTEKFPK